MTGCIIDHASEDADVINAHTTVASARHRHFVLNGYDTDLLVFVLHHAEMDARDVFIKPGPKES